MQNTNRNAKRNTKAREDVGIPRGSDSMARSPPPSVTITSHSIPTKYIGEETNSYCMVEIYQQLRCNENTKIPLLFLEGDPIYVVPRKCNKFSPGLNFVQFSFD